MDGSRRGRSGAGTTAEQSRAEQILFADKLQPLARSLVGRRLTSSLFYFIAESELRRRQFVNRVNLLTEEISSIASKEGKGDTMSLTHKYAG